MPIFIPFKYPTSSDGEYTEFLSNDRIFFNRRTRLGLTQQDVAKMARIPLRQYQRLESGEANISKTTTEIALSVCAVLLLDPYKLINPQYTQPDPETLKAQYTLDSIASEDSSNLKRVGRKPIQKDVMSVYFNHPNYSMIIPREVLIKYGRPSYIRTYYSRNKHRILLESTRVPGKDTYDVPEYIYDSQEGFAGLAFPTSDWLKPIKKDLNWNDMIYIVECRLVKSINGKTLLLCILDSSKSCNEISGSFAVPSCLDNDD